jgi:hypothetical protein
MDKQQGASTFSIDMQNGQAAMAAELTCKKEVHHRHEAWTCSMEL